MNQQITGLHHVTAVTGDAPANVAFYTQALGLRLVKKTVNQDDVGAYHLFYGDELGRPGTEVTFFDWPMAGRNRPGAGTVSETALRVRGDHETLAWWEQWFNEKQVEHEEIHSGAKDKSASLLFRDPEGQRLRLVATETSAGEQWRGSPAPAGAGILGLDAVTLSLRRPEITARLLVDVLGFRETGDGLFETAVGGPGARVYLRAESSPAYLGRGGVHHVAFRAPDAETQLAWRERVVAAGLSASEVINRYYFHSVYFREPNGVLFEIATDGPGFTADEDPKNLGETLSLPPFLKPHRERIEAELRPLETSNIAAKALERVG
jgi:glyoxalase family protein